ncbi:translation initiation factor 3 subunit J [Cladophialophora psammophila CBS 110553]|uniref:Eukaryotic translation initiation factor 3 subunit J n=1 Tax=Cladophialophora psammophila CBS 110553 TaxID=1182543 RepID=W9XG28_9EURO|nr:translation initiation factor 3 subunit J [Cladophialophora psammophila CBS 110553]EXJ75876.1 translation initiation factor 3 subunit J [Cladophialophora psammophila CBS 110553]
MPPSKWGESHSYKSWGGKFTFSSPISEYREHLVNTAIWTDDESEESSEEESVDVPVARRKFADEEDSDEVAENWEEEEDSEAEREKATKAAAAKAKADAESAATKKTKSQRIEEHRDANRRKRAEEEEDEEESSEEDETTRRARLRKSEQDSDLKHAQDLFADAALEPKSRAAPNKAVIIEDKANPGQTIDLSQLPLFKPATKSQFDALSTTLVPLLTAASLKPHFAIWLPTFVKQICADLPSAEIKKAASALTALSNEKMKEEKAQEKGGKRSKAAKTKSTLAATRDMGRGIADVTSYDDGLGDDDFM